MDKAVLLAVDDERSNLMLLERLVKRHLPFVELLTAGSAEEGLAIASQRELDGVLLDVQMPGMNGIELCRRLKSDDSTAHLPILCVTGRACSTDLKIQGLEAGAMDFIAKPVSNVEMVAKIKVMLRIKETEDRLRELNARLEDQVDQRTQSLRESEKMIRVLLNAPTDFVAVVELDGTIVDCNRSGAHRFHKKVEDLVGRRLNDLFPPDVAERRTRYMNIVARAGIPIRFEDECEGVWNDTVLYPVQDEKRNVSRIAILARDITERKRLEKEILEIGDAENRRIGQNLHDGLLQHLTGISSLSQVLRNHLADQPGEDSAMARDISNLLKQAVDQARGLSKVLYPIELEKGGFPAAMRDLTENLQNVFHVACSLRCDPSLSLPDIEAATHLYRIAQEGVNNAAKHGKPGRIWVDVSEKKGEIVLKVEDDGKGIEDTWFLDDSFDWNVVGNGMGLRIMKSRADTIKASLRIQARPQGGTRVICTLPKNKRVQRR